MEDFYILNAGYQSAINDVLKSLQDLNEYDIIKSRLERISEKHRISHDDNNYKGVLGKYYDEEHNLGYVILNDINHIEGALLMLSNKKYEELPEKELVFVIDTVKKFKVKEFDNEEKIKEEYNNILSNFAKL